MSNSNKICWNVGLPVQMSACVLYVRYTRIMPNQATACSLSICRPVQNRTQMKTKNEDRVLFFCFEYVSSVGRLVSFKKLFNRMDFSQCKRKIKKQQQQHKLNTRETQIQSEYIKMKLSTRMQTNNIHMYTYISILHTQEWVLFHHYLIAIWFHGEKEHYSRCYSRHLFSFCDLFLLFYCCRKRNH